MKKSIITGALMFIAISSIVYVANGGIFTLWNFSMTLAAAIIAGAFGYDT